MVWVTKQCCCIGQIEGNIIIIKKIKKILHVLLSPKLYALNILFYILVFNFDHDFIENQQIRYLLQQLYKFKVQD